MPKAWARGTLLWDLGLSSPSSSSLKTNPRAVLPFHPLRSCRESTTQSPNTPGLASRAWLLPRGTFPSRPTRPSRTLIYP